MFISIAFLFSFFAKLNGISLILIPDDLEDAYTSNDEDYYAVTEGEGKNIYVEPFKTLEIQIL